MPQLCTVELPPLPMDMILPPLPSIDDDLAAVALTHTSVASKPRRPTAIDAEVAMDYNKLAFIGDGILSGVINTLLHRLYPGLPSGTATILKGQVVRNTLLAQIAVRYGLHDRIRASAENKHVVLSSVKAQADVFEAYIASVYYENLENYCNPSASLDSWRVTYWLTSLFTPIAEYAVEYMRAATMSGKVVGSVDPPGHDLDERAQGGASFLNTWVSQHNGKRYAYFCEPPTVEYEDSPVGEQQVNLLWRVKCTFNDGYSVHEAEAIRSTKNAAKNVAAWKACRLAGIDGGP